MKQWLAKMRKNAFITSGTSGAIVMNANPFTWGHYHLVEYALRNVDCLYIFVVQEDKSLFSFEERIQLVRVGVNVFGDSVQVVPSGKFIISSLSFPGYFSKEEILEDTDSTADILIFGSIIAPELHITHRFTGEEPTDIVTKNYNDAMWFLLPDMGITMHTIPRKTLDGKNISASSVRAAMKDNNMQLIKSLVPQTTYNYLMKKNFSIEHNTKK
jgi:[citrate (pro-3S)-lyase] ligase